MKPALIGGRIPAANPSEFSMTEDQRVQTSAPTRRKRTNPLLLILLGVALAAVIGYGLYFLQVQRPTLVNREMNTETVQQTVGLAGARPLVLDRRFGDS